MMTNRFFLPLILSLVFSVQIFAQNQKDDFSVLFYNVENLFDPKDDPETLDEEFTPDGQRHWTYTRLNKKLLNLSKVILSSAGFNIPGIIGLCEIENQTVLQKLLADTPLNNYPYKIIHKESPDERGIDVALIYNEDIFYPLFYRYFPLKNENNSTVKTREILYVSGIIRNSDTLHFFINHWPSRYGGLLETQHLRNLAAQTLRNQYDDLQQKYHNPKVIIMGDFNDQPMDESINKVLGTSDKKSNFSAEEIVNLSKSWLDDETGTIKYQSQWSVFDQVMVSGSLLNNKYGIATDVSLSKIVKLPFLFESDERYSGIKPKRTYYGYDYTGGFSDHLPILLQLKLNH